MKSAAARNPYEVRRRNFSSSPIPAWVLDAETLAFLAVNQAAVDHYGYSEHEFLQMTIRDVCVPEDLPQLEPWARLWRQWTSASFLSAYRRRAAGAAFLPEDPREFAFLLDRHMLAKAYYEQAATLGNEDAKAALKRAQCPIVIKDKSGKFVGNLCF